MEMEQKEIAERLEAATTLLERTLNWLEERASAATALSGEVERISATVEQSRREVELAEKAVRGQTGIERIAGLGNSCEPAAQNHARGYRGNARQARARGRSSECAGPGRSPGWLESGAAHCGEDATAARRSDRLTAADSRQLTAGSHQPMTSMEELVYLN